MRNLSALCLALAWSTISLCTAPVASAAEAYAIDGAHSAVAFKISHLGLSWTHGRFNELTGEFVIDAADPAKTSINVEIKADSIDTGNKMRDDHLKSPDFLNTKEFPLVTFKSTAVQPIQNGYRVTGDFTLHGVTKALTFDLVGGRTGEFPQGVHRTGYSTELKLKRSEYGIDKMLDLIGDDVYINISFEGTRK